MAQLNKLMEEKMCKKRINGYLLNSNCSITQRTSTHKSFKASAARQAFTNKRIPIVFEILFWLLQCKSVFSSAGELKNCTVVFCCASAKPVAVPVLYCTTILHLCFYLPLLFPHWYRQMLFLCKALQNEPGYIWYTFGFISYNILMSVAFFKYLIYTFH